MATPRWTAGSLNKKQVDTLLISGAGATNDTVKLTIDNVDFITTIGGTTTTAGIATTVQQAFSGTTLTDATASSTIAVADGGASLIPQFSEFTATISGSTVTFTGNGSGALAGKPITMTAAKTGTLTITYTANVTTPTSQYHANEADNYSTNVVPANSDTLVFDNGSTDMRYSLSLGVQLLTINKYKGYTGNVGLAEVNTDNGAKPYHDYRTPTYLTTNNNSVTTTLNYEIGDGQGSGRFKWDAGAGQAIVNGFGKGTRAEAAAGVPCLLFKGSHVSNVVNNLASDIGIAFYGGETATVATLVNGDGPTSSAYAFCGSGATLTTVRIAGGQVVTNSAITTATIYGGQLDHYSGTITTLASNGGTVYIHGACTITSAGTVYGKIDLSKSAGTVTFTNLVTLDGESEIYDPQGKATFSAGYKLNSLKAKVTRPPGDTHTLS